MKEYHTNKTNVIKIDPFNIDFSSTSSQFSVISSIENYLGDKNFERYKQY